MNVIRWDGQPINKPGLYSGVPIRTYHEQLTEAPSASKSLLWKVFDKSPRHCWRELYLNPDAKEFEANEALLLGRGAHHLILGEADFWKHFAVEPETYLDPKGEQKPWNNNATACREWRRHMTEGEGRDVLARKHIEAIRGMAEGLGEEPLVRQGVLNGLIEHTMVWQDEETGLWLKVRPDAIPNDSLDFGDLKTIADISDDGIEKAIGEHGYNMQGAMIGMGCKAVLGREMTSFSLIFAEKADPFCARVVTLKPEDLALGEKQVRASIRSFARCLERGVWPGPGGHQTDAAYVEMKPFHRTRIEHRLAVMEQELAA